MPMYIIHDLHLESDGLSARIDYLIFTKKICFVIECKNLFGNIEITDKGDYIRTIEFDGEEIKDKVIMVEELVDYIKDKHEKSKEPEMSDEALLSWAEFFLNSHKEKEIPYLEKYNKYLIDNNSVG